MKQDFTIWRNQILQNPQNISPLKFGMSQDEVIEIFGKPDAVSTMRSDGKPLSMINKYFGGQVPAYVENVTDFDADLAKVVAENIEEFHKQMNAVDFPTCLGCRLEHHFTYQ